jgi:hypothetical protein
VIAFKGRTFLPISLHNVGKNCPLAESWSFVAGIPTTNVEHWKTDRVSELIHFTLQLTLFQKIPTEMRRYFVSDSVDRCFTIVFLMCTNESEIIHILRLFTFYNHFSYLQDFLCK